MSRFCSSPSTARSRRFRRAPARSVSPVRTVTTPSTTPCRSTSGLSSSSRTSSRSRRSTSTARRLRPSARPATAAATSSRRPACFPSTRSVPPRTPSSAMWMTCASPLPASSPPPWSSTTRLSPPSPCSPHRMSLACASFLIRRTRCSSAPTRLRPTSTAS